MEGEVVLVRDVAIEGCHVFAGCGVSADLGDGLGSVSLR